MKYKAYTYLLKFKPENKFYYGVRFKNIKLNRHPEDDLIVHYTTSSEQINDLINRFGINSFEWEIRKTFDTPEKAILWETKVLRRLGVLKRQEVWYNANVAGSKITTVLGRKRISERHTGVPKTESHKEKIRQSMKGKKKPARGKEYRELMSSLKKGPKNAMYGKPCSAERAAKIGMANKGKIPINKGVPMSEEQKQKIKETKNKNKILLTCEICGKTMRQANFKQYGHGDSCRSKGVAK